MVWLAGVDGIKDQWCVVLANPESEELLPPRIGNFQDVLNLPENPTIVAVDLPIGLPDVTLPRGRTCDRIAREIIGPRAPSVFSPIGRKGLQGKSRAEADRLQRSAGGIGIGAQAWGLRNKLLEVNALMTPSRQDVVREVHPEVSFCTMKGRTLDFGKKTPEGERERLEALIAQGFPESFMVAKLAGMRSGRDDFLDARAALWTATRIYLGTAQRIPVTAERDSRGLDMAIWF